MRSQPAILAYSEAVRHKRDQLVLEMAQIVDPRLKTLNVSTGPLGVSLYGDVGLKELIPISMMGGGLESAIHYGALAVTSEPGGVVMTDEFENGLYYSKLAALWSALIHAAVERDLQLVVTTHSIECIQALKDVAFPEMLLVHRIQRSADGHSVVDTFDSNILDAADEMGVEFR